MLWKIDNRGSCLKKEANIDKQGRSQDFVQEGAPAKPLGAQGTPYQN